MVATGYLYVMIPKGFFPQQDTGFIFGELDVREDASVAQTDKIRRQVVDIVMHDPGVQGVFSYDGATPYNPAENTARIFWGLKPYDERDATAEQIIAAPAQEGRRHRGRQILHAGAAKHHGRRPAVAHPVPVHADRHQQR